MAKKRTVQGGGSTRKEIREAKQAEARKRNMTIGAGIGAVALVLIGLLIYATLDTGPGEVEIEGVVEFAGVLDRGHDVDLEIPFEARPPMGGIHDAIWQNCGLYDTPVPPQNALHSLEHGAVWVTHRTDLPQEEVDSLWNMMRGEGFVLLSPYPNQESPIVLTAWGVQLELESTEDERIEQFVDYYQVGPQTPELGATCQGGLGVPAS